jgi:hypothetical protein
MKTLSSSSSSSSSSSNGTVIANNLCQCCDSCSPKNKPPDKFISRPCIVLPTRIYVKLQIWRLVQRILSSQVCKAGVLLQAAVAQGIPVG